MSFHCGDVRSFEYPARGFSHVIHAATQASAALNQQDPSTMLDTIVEGTRRVLYFSVRCGARAFLLTSSGAVYGRQPSLVSHLPESYAGTPDTMNPQSAYGEGKRMAELLCAIYAGKHGLETKIARCFAFTGPYLPLDDHFAAGNFVRDQLRGGPIQVNGDGRRSALIRTPRNVWLERILFRGRSCRPYNVGSDEDVAIAELAATVAGLRPGTAVRIAAKPVPGAPVERYVPDISRARGVESGAHGFAGRGCAPDVRMGGRKGAGMKKTAIRACPVCGNCSAKVLHSQKFVLQDSHPVANGYDVVACMVCGMVYADTGSPQRAYDALYQDASKYEDNKTSTGGGEWAWDAERLAETAQAISSIAGDKTRRMVDIGCANGGVLEALRSLGHDSLAGIDPAPACVANTRRRGFEAYAGSLSAIPDGVGTFDVLVLSHVLEHVRTAFRFGRFAAASPPRLSRLYRGPGRHSLRRLCERSVPGFQHRAHQPLFGICLDHLTRQFHLAPEAPCAAKVVKSSIDTLYPALFGIYRYEPGMAAWLLVKMHR